MVPPASRNEKTTVAVPGSAIDTSDDSIRNDAWDVFKDPSLAVSQLAQELNQLSVQERDMINDEVHGIGVYFPKETPELLKNSLAKLHLELDSLPSTPKKKAYSTSLKFPESYIHKDDFRLMFLRWALFDAHKAAIRMINYLDFISYLFGQKVLQRDISLADFDRKSMEYMRKGIVQILPGMDPAGRRVAIAFERWIPDNEEFARFSKCNVYIAMKCLKGNVDNQRMGVVGIWWVKNLPQFSHVRNCASLMVRMANAMPIRLCASHCCLQHSSETLYKIINAYYIISGDAHMRRRARFHRGSLTECIYQLQTFGIQAFNFPLNPTTGKIKTENHLKWLQLHQLKEKALLQNSTFDAIECPEHTDILFGRGWPTMGHHGNVTFRNTLESRFEEYNSIESKKEKTIVNWTIVAEIKKSGARFLRQDESGFWMEVSDEVARKKVSIGFRDIRKAQQKLDPSSKNGQSTLKTATAAKRKVPSEELDALPDEDASSSAYKFLEGGKRHRSSCGAVNENCL